MIGAQMQSGSARSRGALLLVRRPERAAARIALGRRRRGRRAVRGSRSRTIPPRVVGFDVEVAALLAAGLGRTPRFVQVGFTTLDAAAARGDFDIGLSGIEDSPARRARLAVTIPYYEFREVLTVREADRERYRTLADLRGRRVATLGATLAYDIARRAPSGVRHHAGDL